MRRVRHFLMFGGKFLSQRNNLCNQTCVCVHIVVKYVLDIVVYAEHYSCVPKQLYCHQYSISHFRNLKVFYNLNKFQQSYLYIQSTSFHSSLPLVTSQKWLEGVPDDVQVKYMCGQLNHYKYYILILKCALFYSVWNQFISKL